MANSGIHYKSISYPFKKQTHDLSTSHLIFMTVSLLILTHGSWGQVDLRPTLPSDKEALLKIKDSLYRENDPRYVNWLRDSDPCLDLWDGIQCHCSMRNTIIPEVQQYCDGYEVEGRNHSRVVVIIMYGGKNTEDRYKGTLSPAFGDLTQLRYLDLSSNDLTGPIPDSFENLKNLRLLSLSDNILTGSLPPFIGKLSNLYLLELDFNKFSGPIPSAWCSENTPWNATLVLNDNRGICGDLPDCLEGQVQSLTNTWIHSQNSGNVNPYGACDNTPPICGHCKVIVPEYWSDRNLIEFEYVNATDPESGIEGYLLSIVASTNLSRSVINPVFITSSNSWIVQSEDEASHVVFNISMLDVQLSDGSFYYVNLTAINRGGPPQNLTFSNQFPVLFDNSPPLPISDLFNTIVFVNVPQQQSGRDFGASWTNSFLDPESGVSYLNITLLKIFTDEYKNDQEIILSYRILNSDETTCPFLNIAIEEDTVYFYKATAFNSAGLNTTLKSESFTLKITEKKSIVNGDNFPAFIVIVISALFFGCINVAILIMIIIRRRKNKNPFDSTKFIVDYMNEILDGSDEDHNQKSDSVILPDGDITFVITDIQDSTAQSTFDDNSFKYLIDIHNKIVREAFERYGGYEILIEGDSFQLAFNSVSNAIKCSMEIQYKMMDYKWSPEILRMPGCKCEKYEFGGFMFKGPKVRIGIHYAMRESCSFTSRIHHETGRTIYEGPGFEIAKEVSNAAHGGQVLLTQLAWSKLDLKQAGYPAIRELGSFGLEMASGSTWLYEIVQLAGRPLHRTFDLPRCLPQHSKGRGLFIVPPPDPIPSRKRSYSDFVENQVMSFAMEPFGATSSGRAANSPHWMPGSHKILTFVATKLDLQNKKITPEFNKYVNDILAIQAQYVGGYIAKNDANAGTMLLSFSNPSDALRYTHLCQLNLVLYDWSEKILAMFDQVISVPQEPPLFRGPKVAMAIHCSKRFRVIEMNHVEVFLNKIVNYDGQGENFTRHLVSIISGGQVVLSSSAWSEIYKPLPGQIIPVDLGKHVIDSSFKKAVMLKQAMPRFLDKRVFPKVRSTRQTEPGFMDAPSLEKEMAIVFAKPHKPKIIQLIENQGGNVEKMDGFSVKNLLYSYNVSLFMFSSLVRKRLPTYSGYECKEPEPGKFTIVFSSFQQAILWACHIQAELLSLDWPQALLRLPECQEVNDLRTGRLMHRGLGVRIGMAYGKASDKIILPTGRADYVGFIANVAAKITQIASPGEVLVRSTVGFDSCNVKWIKTGVGIIEYSKALSRAVDGIDEVAIELVCLGGILLKEVTEPQTIYLARGTSVAVQEVNCLSGNRSLVPINIFGRFSFKNLIKHLGIFNFRQKMNYYSVPSGVSSSINNSAYMSNANMSDQRQLKGSSNPNKILSLLSRSCSYSAIRSDSMPNYDPIMVFSTDRRARSFSGHPYFGSASSAQSGHASSYLGEFQGTPSTNSFASDSGRAGGPTLTMRNIEGEMDHIIISMGEGCVPAKMNHGIEVIEEFSDDNEEVHKNIFASQRSFPFLSGRASFSFAQFRNLRARQSADITLNHK